MSKPSVRPSEPVRKPLILYIAILMIVLLFYLLITYSFSSISGSLSITPIPSIFYLPLGSLFILILGMVLYFAFISLGKSTGVKYARTATLALFIALLLVLFFSIGSITEPIIPYSLAIMGFLIASSVVSTIRSNYKIATVSVITLLLVVAFALLIFNLFYSSTIRSEINFNVVDCGPAFVCRHNDTALLANGTLKTSLSLVNSTNSDVKILGVACGEYSTTATTINGSLYNAYFEPKNITLAPLQKANVSIACVPSSYYSSLLSYFYDGWECEPPMVGCPRVGATIMWFNGQLSIKYEYLGRPSSQVLYSNGFIATGLP